MHKVIQLISNFFYKKNMPPSMKVHVHYMNLMKNQIIQKSQSLQIFKEKVTREFFFFEKPFEFFFMFNGFKMSSLRCRLHV